MSDLDLTDLAREVIPCSYCRADVGAQCRTKSGRRSSYLHAARTEPLYAAWRDGFGEGEQGVAYWLRHGPHLRNLLRRVVTALGVPPHRVDESPVTAAALAELNDLLDRYVR